MDALTFWKTLWAEMANMTILDLPPPKLFKQKFPLPVLTDYRVEFPPWFWSMVPSNLSQPATSLVNGDVLYRLAVSYSFNDLTLLGTIRNDLKCGAEIGCKGKFRNPSKATNAPSAYEYGA